jgi:hypothetical protein
MPQHGSSHYNEDEDGARCGREMSNGEECVLPAGHTGPHRNEVGDDGE